MCAIPRQTALSSEWKGERGCGNVTPVDQHLRGDSDVDAQPTTKPRCRTCSDAVWYCSHPTACSVRTMSQSRRLLRAQSPESQEWRMEIGTEENPSTYSSPSRRPVLGKRSPFRTVSKGFQAGKRPWKHIYTVSAIPTRCTPTLSTAL